MTAAVAGIDEAGYGPLLGPLVVGCVRVAHQQSDPEALLARALTDAGLAADDSKKIYRNRGLAGLEATVLPLACVSAGKRIQTLGQLADAVTPNLDLDTIPWYTDWRALELPVAADAAPMADAAGTVESALEGGRIELCATVLSARRFNAAIDRLGNKSDLLTELSGRQIQTTAQHEGNTTIVCDKQGGRKFYADTLRTWLPNETITIVREQSRDSTYRAGTTQITFAQGADGSHRCVGLASMLCKYLRELMMMLFNRWWANHQPGLTPTAGYWVDGTRFLEQIAPHLQALNIHRSDLVRNR